MPEKESRKENKEENNDQEIINLLEDNKSEEKQQELQQINDSLSFNTRSLSSVADSLVENLGRSQITIQKILDAMQISLNQQKQIVLKMNDESRVLCLIPQKMQDRIDNIAPKIATEVGLIYNTKIIEINDQFNVLQDKLTKDFDGYRQELATTTAQYIQQLISTSDDMKVIIEQKLTHFGNQLAAEVEVISSHKNMRFLKNLAFIILFSSLVSASTSYLVATQFPRYVRVDAPNNLSITDSKVQVWEAKIPDKNQPQFDKQKKEGK